MVEEGEEEIKGFPQWAVFAAGVFVGLVTMFLFKFTIGGTGAPIPFFAPQPQIIEKEVESVYMMDHEGKVSKRRSL